MESIGFLAIMLLAFWLLIIRPSRARARKQAQLLDELTPGQQVMTTAGLFATVAAVEEDAVVLEAAPGVQTRWAKAAIARIVTPPEPAADAETIDVTDAQSSNPTTGRPE